MAQAHVEYDPMRFGVRMAVTRYAGECKTQVITWGELAMATVDRNMSVPDDAWLHLDEDIARAMYEALARHFGGSPDALSMRKDYDAERKRVDQFIAHLTRG